MTCLKLNEKKSHIYALQVFFTIIKPGSSKCRSLEKNNYIYIYILVLVNDIWGI